MAAIFYILGGLSIFLGLAWALIAVTAGSGIAEIGILARLLAATPGLGLAGSGLLILAVGGVLSRLDTLILLNRGLVRDAERRR